VTTGQANVNEPTRERVRAAMRQVGGYWRPLAAVARLQEELGELAELLMTCAPDVEQHAADLAERWLSELAEQCASELADLWIISTAIADQFLGCVAEPDSYPRRPPPSGDLLGNVVIAAGRIARIVNYYDGPKTPRTLEGWVPLSDAVAELHRALAEVAHAHDVDLAFAVNEKLDAIPVLDAGRFRDGEHDPSTAMSLERFPPLQAASPGLLAERARLWGSPEWSSTSFTSNVEAIVAELTSFTRAATWERLDGYLISGPSFTSTGLLDDWLRRLLVEMSDRDPVNEQPAPGPLDSADRQFAFNGLRLLVAVFSPLYATSDPRHSPAGTFVLLAYPAGGAAGSLTTHGPCQPP
jgi:NTP pyrophosphatase (non-canonical NTP hydrolase)